MNCIDYFNEVYLAKRDLCRTAVFDYRNALRRLQQHEGREIDIDEISPEMVERLTVFLHSIGLSKKTVFDRANQVRAVARHWCPERFPWTRTIPPGRRLHNHKRLPPVEVKPVFEPFTFAPDSSDWL